MNAEQLAQFKQKILDAIHAHLQSGGKIISGSFGWWREDKCQCPIGCLISWEEADKGGVPVAISRTMGFPVSGQEVDSFIDGFDNNAPLPFRPHIPEIYQLGQELRIQFLAP